MEPIHSLKYISLPTDQVRGFQRGTVDSNGLMPERVSQGGGPCRHCLCPIHPHEEMLILGYCPFPSLQPYAETGPIFLHAKECKPYTDINVLPVMFSDSPDALMIVRGYNYNDRIEYGATAVISVNRLEKNCRDLLINEDVAYLHIRSALTNCYQFRVDGGSSRDDSSRCDSPLLSGGECRPEGRSNLLRKFSEPGLKLNPTNLRQIKNPHAYA